MAHHIYVPGQFHNKLTICFIYFWLHRGVLFVGTETPSLLKFVQNFINPSYSILP